MSTLEYVSFDYDYPPSVGEKTYDYVQLPMYKNKGAPRMLIVLDYMPSEDLKSAKMLSGDTGVLLRRLLAVANKYYAEPKTLDDYAWLAVSYSAFKTAGGSNQQKDAANEVFKDRLHSIIGRYKPDVVLTFGRSCSKALNQSLYDNHDGREDHFLGRHVKTSIRYEGKSHKFSHVSTMSLNTLLSDPGSGSTFSLAGYVARNISNALHGSNRYTIPKLSYKTELVDTIEKFDAMMKEIRKKPRLAIDTESTSLNRRVNSMLTIQFAYSKDKAFIVPISHKDSPFVGKELSYIRRKLCAFFEKRAENKIHIYANAKFDLTLIRNFCNVKYFKTDVWCLFAGEFVLDENMKNLNTFYGRRYYSLLNLSMQYGCDAYYKAAFGKDQRKTIASVDLDDNLIEYCALDVIVPLYIQELQCERGRDCKYDKYELMVSTQMSDTSHMFSVWEYNGCPTDIEYLFYLKTKDSPIRAEVAKAAKALIESEGARKVNKILTKKAGAPVVGLFGATQLSLFDPSKREHQQLLFFEVLKLKPTDRGTVQKDGSVAYKVDKNFQDAHKTVPEVKLYNDLQKANKLYNAYVKSLIKNWGVDEDMRFDSRIRPHFEYLDVVTGRTSAKKPSLHQVPSRSELGKHIKRLFRSEAGRFYIKVDYSAHEVRCWSLFAGDQTVADLFEHGRELRRRYRLQPTPELLERIDIEGDVHKINAAYFFGVDISKVDKKLRNAVKTVIFGLIYQQGIKGLSASTGQTIEALEKLIGQFKAKHKVGVAWFDKVKAFGKKHLFVEAPSGRRRHVWGSLMPKDYSKASGSVIARNERQSVNSPVQGGGSDFLVVGARCVERLKFEHFERTGHYPDFYQANSVHDAVIFSCAYDDLWLAVDMIERGLTEEVAKTAKARYGLDFLVPLEIDFEIGNNERDVISWTGDYDQMKEIVKACLKERAEEGEIEDPKAVYRSIMRDHYDDMPTWLQKQLWNKGIKLPNMVKDIRKKSDVIRPSKSSRNKEAA